MTGLSPNGEYKWERSEISLLGADDLVELYTEDECRVMADKAMSGAYEAFNHVFKDIMKTEFTMSYLGCTE